MNRGDKAKTGTFYWFYAILILLVLSAYSCASLHPNHEVEDGGVMQSLRAEAPGKIFKVKSSPAAGFYWNYYLFVPHQASDTQSLRSQRLVVAPNNTGTSSDDMRLHDRRARDYIQELSRSFGRELGTAVLVPVFSRPGVIKSAPRDGWVYYTHALDRQSLQLRVEPYQRIDLQLIAMIEHARSILDEHGLEVEPEVFMYGFSASGNYTNRFVFMHPERVQAAAAGGLNGMPLLPAGQRNGRKLYYPVGVYDLQELTGRPLNLAAVRTTPQYLFMGELDANDTLPYDDAFDRREREIIIDVFDTVPFTEQKESNAPILLKRFAFSEKVYAEFDLSARFVVYEGIGHGINKQVWEDLFEFFRQHAD